MQPASTCPYCLQEGEPHWNQLKRNGRQFGVTTLTDAVRFICPNGHEWLTDREWALLQRAFLDRQTSP